MGTHWSLQDAKNRFSAVVDAARRGEPQHVTRRGIDAVVVLSAEEYKRLTALDAGAPRDFVAHLLDAPKLPEDCQDLFDRSEPFELEWRDVDFEA